MYLSHSSVGMLSLITILDGKAALIVANTHLTFPHHDYDEKVLRVKQMSHLLKGINQYIKKHESKLPKELFIVVAGGKFSLQFNLVQISTAQLNHKTWSNSF